MKDKFTVFKQSVRLKLFLSYILLFTFPLLLMGSICYFWLSNVIKSNTESSYQNKLVNISETLDKRVQELDKFALQLSQTTWVKEIMMKTFMVDPISALRSNEELQLYKQANYFIDDIALYFSDKDLVFSSIGLDNLDWFSENAFKVDNMNEISWREITNKYNKGFILPPSNVYSYGRKRTGLIYLQSFPITRDYDIRATLIAFINRTTVENLLNPLLTDPNTEVYVMDKDKNLIGEQNAGEGTLAVVKSLAYPKARGILYNIHQVGNDTMVFYEKSSYTGWQIVTIVPMKSVMEKVRQVQLVILVLMVISLLIGFLLSYEFTVRNYMPLNNLICHLKEKFYSERTYGKYNEYAWLETTIHGLLDQEDQLKKQIEQQEPILRGSYLSRLIKDDFCTTPEFLKMLELLGIVFTNPIFCCCAIAAKYVEKGVLDILVQSADKYSILIYFTDVKDYTVGICNFSDKSDFNEFVMEINEKLNAWSRKITIGAGGLHTALEEIYTSYREAVSAMGYRLIKGSNIVILYEETKDNDSYYYYSIDKEECIANYLRAGDYENARKLFCRLLEENTCNEHISANALKYFFFNVYLTAIKVVKEAGLKRTFNPDIDNIFTNDTIDTSKIKIEQVFSHICEVINRDKESHNTQMSQAIFRYIDENICNSSLSLSSISIKFDISSSYLSRFIKDQSGNNFLDYVNRKRINYSKLLLKNADLDINTIALQVGYTNDVTFRRLFKKYEGVSPVQYRNN